MEAAPPSYEKATLINAWDIIAQYIPSSDLCSAALVCSAWHTVFAPHLWGNPASHFGHENDRVYVALTRFKRTLPWARLSVRSLTHTLHLPPAHAELYNGPNSDWLREVLERLPNLQSLIVRGLPFFDHASLAALRLVKQVSTSSTSATSPTLPNNRVELSASPPPSLPHIPRLPSNTIPSTFNLRLLDASRCPNVTSRSLSHALQRLENLIYLNLSWTIPARDVEVLKCLRIFSGLQVLKLQGISLRDEDINILAPAIGTRVRSLDLRHNLLTDRSVRTLLDSCFLSIPAGQPAEDSPRPGDRSPALLHYLGAEMLATYRGEDFEGYLRNAFTTSFVSRLAFEDAPEGGITHLYIANNKLTVEGMSGLLRSGRLHVLDAGTVQTRPVRHPSLSMKDGTDSNEDFPGAEKLVPVLTESANTALTFLRIDHSLITKKTPDLTEEQVVPGRVELPETSLPRFPADAVEIDSTPVYYELPAETSPRYELEGDPISMLISPAVGEPLQTTEKEEEEMMKARRGSAVAPEAVNPTADSLLSPAAAEQTFTPTTGNDLSSQKTRGRQRSYSSVLAERQARKYAHQVQSKSLYPGALPNLTTLILTDVPPTTSNPDATERIISFIRSCAEESNLARQQARLDYTLPPGRRGSTNMMKDSARRLFALERIVLEMAPNQRGRRKSLGSAWHHDATKSMTEDRDSEALWSAAETDFSFFGEGEECGLPSLEPGRTVPNLSAMNGKEVVADMRSRPTSSTTTSASLPLGSGKKEPPPPQFDTVAKIAEFRKSRKAAYNAIVGYGEAEPDVEGYWPGLVQVVRPSNRGAMAEDDEFADYYGNRFSKNYLYR